MMKKLPNNEEKVKKIIEELLPLLKKYNSGQINYQIEMLSWLLKKLDEGGSLNNIDFYDFRKKLYPQIGGLTDFYIWDDDYLRRLELNQPIDTLNNKLWDIIKIYIS